MRYIVLKAFPYSADGKHTVMLPASEDPVEIRADLADSLVAASYIAAPRGGAKVAKPEVVAPVLQAAAGGAPASVIEIPADWASKEFGFFNLQGLVLRLTGVKPANKAEAVTAVEAELARRAASNA